MCDFAEQMRGVHAQLWDVLTGDCKATLVGHTSHVVSIAFTPDGKKVVTASWDETVKLWDTAEAFVDHTFTGHLGKVNCVCVAPDGDTIISGGEDKTVKLWKISTGVCVCVKSLRADELWWTGCVCLHVCVCMCLLVFVCVCVCVCVCV
jgi:WD40 repeat protein